MANGSPLPERNSEWVWDNFGLFQDKLTAVNVSALWAGTNKLMVVGVSLEEMDKQQEEAALVEVELMEDQEEAN